MPITINVSGTLTDGGTESPSDGIANYVEYKQGILVWKVNKGPRAQIGSPVGSATNNYMRFKLNGKTYANHRVIFYLHNGWWPKEVDHINTNTFDNRIENLRAATKSENQANGKPYNGRALKGCYTLKSGNYMAVIQKDKVRHYLGVFSTEQEAAAAYASAAATLHGKFARCTAEVS